jgi:hypothetical protein
MTNRERLSIPAGTFAAIAVLALATVSARADTVSAGGTVSENVSVQTIRAGKLFFIDAAGALAQAPIEAVEWIQFDGLIDLESAQRAMLGDEWEEALPKLLLAMQKAEGDAQELWIHAKLAETHGQLGDFIEAAGHAAAVLDIDPSPVWLSLVPRGELNEPTFYSTGEAMYFLKRAQREAIDGDVSAALAELTARIEPLAEEIARDDARQYRPGSTISGILIRDIARPLAPRETGNGGNSAPPSDRAAPQPGRPAERSGPESPAAIAGLLADGEYLAARAICERVAESPGARDLAQFLHQYGQALAGTASYDDAAVRYMQCAIEFPDTSYATWSLIETAVIHNDFYKKLDTAERLLLLASLKAEEEGDAASLERARALLAGEQAGASESNGE